MNFEAVTFPLLRKEKFQSPVIENLPKWVDRTMDELTIKWFNLFTGQEKEQSSAINFADNLISGEKPEVKVFIASMCRLSGEKDTEKINQISEKGAQYVALVKRVFDHIATREEVSQLRLEIRGLRLPKWVKKRFDSWVVDQTQGSDTDSRRKNSHKPSLPRRPKRPKKSMGEIWVSIKNNFSKFQSRLERSQGKTQVLKNMAIAYQLLIMTCLGVSAYIASLPLKGETPESEEANPILAPEEQIEVSRDEQLEAYAKRGIGTQMGYPEIKGVNDPNFLSLRADMLWNFTGKYGASFMFATYLNESGGEAVNQVLVQQMAEQTGYTTEYLNSVWIQARDDRDFALQVFRDAPKPVDAKVLQTFEKADQLIDSDLSPETSQDRRDDLIKWFKERFTEGVKRENQTEMSSRFMNEAKSILGDNSYWAETAIAVASQLGLDGQDFLGTMGGLAADWRYDPDAIAKQLKAVEMVATIYPEERVALYAGFATSNLDFINVCLMVGLMLAGQGVRKLGTINLPEIDLNASGENLKMKLINIGRRVVDNLQINSQEFRDWQEELRQKNNSRQLVNRLRNGLSLSREFVFDLGGILNNPQNQDLRDLVLIEGPNWFRHMPETHPEMPHILRFFGCKNFADLQDLANQPDRIVNRLYRVLVGRGKKADLRNTEEVRNLIALYKKGSGFIEVENQ